MQLSMRAQNVRKYVRNMYYTIRREYIGMYPLQNTCTLPDDSTDTKRSGEGTHRFNSRRISCRKSALSKSFPSVRPALSARMASSLRPFEWSWFGFEVLRSSQGRINAHIKMSIWLHLESAWFSHGPWMPCPATGKLPTIEHSPSASAEQTFAHYCR
jgi:hypothetical protein